MTRGRRKDMTIPPSRALLQQRDYRARKAQYLADLEFRVKKAEEENVLLHKEVDALHAKLKSASTQAPSPFGPEVAAASSDLMHHLTVAAASVTRFQQLAFYPAGAGAGGPAPHVNRTPITLATPNYNPSPVAPPITHPRAQSSSVSPRIELPPLSLSPPSSSGRRPSSEFELGRRPSIVLERDRERAYREPLPSVYPHRSMPASVMGPAPHSARYPNLDPRDPDCCDGYVDCRTLTQDEDEEDDDEDELMDEDEAPPPSRARFAQRTSDVRSTASSASGPEDGPSPHSSRLRQSPPHVLSRPPPEGQR
ncbi:uncharacterized protein BXZ73DRAFT_47329 [Epithele typhae]|uniref:uncharacterized protein n=1 Tax=Epithele typhae TaxID=378194 RepID=UPI002008BF35|nr:uncharacterized protein BXZ73DRAFT_47329 [Epithele typhae]KAH9931082.1 hypothetical protein BXZ73DRAFT_47329 [Epithele typhae]